LLKLSPLKFCTNISVFFGSVQDIYIPMDHTRGGRKQFGFVTMKTIDEIRNVLKDPVHDLGGGYTITVTEAQPREQNERGGAGMPTDWQDPTAAFGKVLPMLPAVGPVRLAQPALAMPRATNMICSTANQLAPSPSLNQGAPGNERIVAFGLHPGISEDMLRGHFARDGEILDIYIPTTKNGSLAYITYNTPDEVACALNNFTGHVGGLPVERIARAEPRDPAMAPKKKDKRFSPY